MFSFIKQLFQSTPPQEKSEERELWYNELQALKKENDKLRQKMFAKEKKKAEPRKIHIEFFLYDPHNRENAAYSESDLNRYPMMGFTLHALDEKSPCPSPVKYMVQGLEDTFTSLKITYHAVNEPALYSFFVNIKSFPQVEVKKSIYLLFHQLRAWQENSSDKVSLRIHVGGDELHQELLENHQQAG
ncbi:hypothetical protein [Mechercharimyces sp. CAU 1602]|uniref:hypothetical protein n=1 Tax=Mechercharimyces sp. CAU 1602 TaxID=2973933 RepID=UPI0021625F09|nr:hypothetical protein [Mechercharimyces sp. CAU 1602]MCS1351343.1 hypothetical protein [Mechercharimyces sp. CAU 1602]